MIPTIDFIKERFQAFNQQIFKGELPTIPLEMGRSRTQLGSVRYSRKRTLIGIKRIDSIKMRFSTAFDLPERVWEDTIIHEMIHLYIIHNGIQDTSPHGCRFRKMMQEINKRFNRDICVTHKNEVRDTERKIIHTSGRWHVIAKLFTTDGRTGFKVLPRVESSILKFYNAATYNSHVTTIQLYMANDPFFEVVWW